MKCFMNVVANKWAQTCVRIETVDRSNTHISLIIVFIL